MWSYCCIRGGPQPSSPPQPPVSRRTTQSAPTDRPSVPSARDHEHPRVPRTSPLPGTSLKLPRVAHERTRHTPLSRSPIRSNGKKRFASLSTNSLVEVNRPDTNPASRASCAASLWPASTYSLEFSSNGERGSETERGRSERRPPPIASSPEERNCASMMRLAGDFSELGSPSNPMLRSIFEGETRRPEEVARGGSGNRQRGNDLVDSY